MTTHFDPPSMPAQPGPATSLAAPDTATVVVAPAPGARHLLPLAAAGAAVAVALGVYGRTHEPTGGVIVDLGFPSMRAMKAWFATGAVALVVVQILSALAMFGRLPKVTTVPRWVPFLHRWSGTTAFVLTLPVAYHCLWALGFQTGSARTFAHSLFGCAFYGAMTTKLLGLRSDRLPKWAIPVLGSLLVVTLTAVWLTSALWFFTSVDFPALPG